ncbi:MAG: 2OG-Fe(II) oxygenase family protein [Pseudomonadota bacterium]
MPLNIRFAPKQDAKKAACEFQKNHRVHLPDFLDAEAAGQLRDAILSETDWETALFLGGRHVDLDTAAWREVSDEKRNATLAAVHAQAAKGFAYAYDKIPIYDRYWDGSPLDHRFRRIFQFLNSAPFLDYMRILTGRPDIAFADLQATRYRCGDFLTVHNDDIANKNRCAAYVLNLTADWREDWGGFLQFFNREGHVEEAFMPKFNALNIFSIPMRHSVSFIPPFAEADRLSITGWLRAGVDESLSAP